MAQYDSELTRLVEQVNRSAKGPIADEAKLLDQFLTLAVERRASDLLFVANSPAILGVNGTLTAGIGHSLSPSDLRGILLPMLTSEQVEELQTQRSLDFCFVRKAIGRFRANYHFQRGTLAASIRLLPEQIPSLESLHLPPALALLAERRQGLVLVTGPTGCGKSSTLAGLIDLINNRRRDHIITVEDPIEFQYLNRNSIVEQIELGHDTRSFAQAVRSALRQYPNVILIGEMRDSETMAAALTAAETGHLVLSSLHTNDAVQTVLRILDIFPSTYQSQIRQQLSLALLAIVSQRLIPASSSVGRYPAVEIMLATSAIRNLIRRGDDHQLRAHIETGKSEGMLTMEQSLAELIRAGRVTRDVGFDHAPHPEDLQRHLS